MQDIVAGETFSSSPEDASLLQQYIAAGDDQDDNGDDYTKYASPEAILTSDAISASIGDAENYDDVAEDEEDFIFDESAVKSIEDEALEDITREVFDELRGESSLITFEQVQGWNDIEDMINNNLVSEDDLQRVWASLKTDRANFDQFLHLVQRLEDVAVENEEIKRDGNDDGATTTLDEKADDAEDEYDEIDEEAEAEMLGEIFETLSDGKKTITLTTLENWDDLAELQLESDEVLDLLKIAGVKVNDKTGRVSGGISEDQFIAFVRALDKAEEIDEDEVAEEHSRTTTGGASTALSLDEATYDEEEEFLELDDYQSKDSLTEEEDKEILEKLYDTLRGTSSCVPVDKFMMWEDVSDLVQERLLTQDDVRILIEEVGCDASKGSLDFAQFSKLVTLLDETLEALEGQHLNEENDPDYIADDDSLTVSDEEYDGKIEASYKLSQRAEDSSGESLQEENMSDEQLEKLARDIYDELRGNAKSLPVKKFKKWEEVQELVSNDIVQTETIDALVKVVTGGQSSTLSFDHFQQLVQLLDEAGEAAFAAAEEKQEDCVTDSVSSAFAQPFDTSNGFIPTSERFLDETAYASTNKLPVPSDADTGVSDEEPNSDEVEEIAREIFNELKNPKTGKLSVKKFQQWETIQEALDAGGAQRCIEGRNKKGRRK